MELNTFKCSYLTSLHLKGLTSMKNIGHLIRTIQCYIQRESCKLNNVLACKLQIITSAVFTPANFLHEAHCYWLAICKYCTLPLRRCHLHTGLPTKFNKISMVNSDKAANKCGKFFY